MVKRTNDVETSNLFNKVMVFKNETTRLYIHICSYFICFGVFALVNPYLGISMLVLLMAYGIFFSLSGFHAIFWGGLLLITSHTMLTAIGDKPDDRAILIQYMETLRLDSLRKPDAWPTPPANSIIQPSSKTTELTN